MAQDQKGFIVVGGRGQAESHAMAVKDLGHRVLAIANSGSSSANDLKAKLGDERIRVFDASQAHGHDGMDNFRAAVAAFPDADAIIGASYPGTHFEISQYALDQGAEGKGIHVFTEKPTAVKGREAQTLVDLASSKEKVLFTGYELRVSPMWAKFREVAQGLGVPLVGEMWLNQRSFLEFHETHRKIANGALSPAADCGIHYIDQMIELLGGIMPDRVLGIGQRYDSQIKKGAYDSSSIVVWFPHEDGTFSTLTYQARWGPNVPTEGYFHKSLQGPKGYAQVIRPLKEGETAPRSHEIAAHVVIPAIEVGNTKEYSVAGDESTNRIISTKGINQDHDHLMREQMRAFVECITGKRNYDFSKRDVNLAYVAQKSVESIQTRQPIAI